MGAYDIFLLFFNQALNVCKEGGYVCLITPNKYLSSPYGFALRQHISDHYTLSAILDLSRVKIFNDPSVYPIITVIQKKRPSGQYTFNTARILSEKIDDRESHVISSELLTLLPDRIWGVILSDNIKIIEKIFRLSVPLSQVAEVQATSTASEADAYSKLVNERKGIRIVNTGTIDRYETMYGFKPFRDKGRAFLRPLLDISRSEISDNRRKLYQSPKVIVAKLALRVESFLDREGTYASINTNCIHDARAGYPLEAIMGILNSRLMTFVYSELFGPLTMSRGYFQFQAPQLRVLPIISKVSGHGKERLVSEVRQIEDLRGQLRKFGTKKTDERSKLEEELGRVDQSIDSIVFDMYGLDEDERRTVLGKH